MDLTQLYYPQVVAFSPTTVSTGVGTLPNIVIDFSVPMDETQFTDLSSVLTLTRISNGSTIGLTLVEYDTDSFTLTVTPSANLVVGENYQVRVSSLIKSSSDRTMESDMVWYFTPDTPEVVPPELVYPEDQSSYETIPALIWSTVASADSYLYQVGISRLFNTESLIVGTSETSATSATLNPSLFTTEREYYWRVCSVTSTASGDWSDFRTFYYGVITASDIHSSLSDPYSSVFRVTSVRPTSGTRSNLTTWPTIRITFSSAPATATVTSSTVWIEYEPVDDNPAIDSGTLDGELSISGSSVTFTPSGDIQQNTKYTIYVSGVEDANSVLVQDYEYSFTGSYYPLYARAGILRNEYGSLLNVYTDDFLNYHLFRASIMCNKAASGYSYDADYEDFITQPTTVTHNMIKYTVLYGAYSILQIRYFELLESADLRRQLGDFTIEQKATALAEIEKALREIKKELTLLELSLSSDVAKPTPGVRSSSWNPTTAVDSSITLVRNRF